MRQYLTLHAIVQAGHPNPARYLELASYDAIRHKFEWTDSFPEESPRRPVVPGVDQVWRKVLYRQPDWDFAACLYKWGYVGPLDDNALPTNVVTVPKRRPRSGSVSAFLDGLIKRHGITRDYDPKAVRGVVRWTLLHEYGVCEPHASRKAEAILERLAQRFAS